MLLRKAVVRLIASPLFTAFAVLSLAAGVAVTTAVYSVVDSLLFAKFEARDPASVAFVMVPRMGVMRRAALSAEDLAALRQGQRSFSHLSSGAVLMAQVASTRQTELMTVEAVDADYFPTLGVTTAIGRVLTASDQQTASRAAVVSRDYWRTRLAGDPDVLSRTLSISGQTFDVVGVIDGPYSGLDRRGFRTQIWVPLSVAPAVRLERTSPLVADQAELTIVGRLAAGVTHATAAAEVETIARQLDTSRPLPPTSVNVPSQPRQWTSRPADGSADESDSQARVGVILVILVALVLVVACTNLANLVLARGSARHGELAIRMAMGASKGRVIWEQCIEGIVLSCVGAVAAYAMFIVLSAWMTQDFALPVPPMGRITLSIRPEINRDALIVSLAALLLSLAVFGLEPAIQLTRSLDIRTVLATGASGIRPRIGRQRMIIRWQVAVATGFFIVATMFIRFTIDQARHESGVDTAQIAVATLGLRSPAWTDDRARIGVDRVLAHAGGESSVSAVTASTGLPFGIPPALQASIARPDVDPAAASRQTSVPAIAATPSVFRVLGIPIVSGRAFVDSDGPSSAPVVVISETTARQFFPSTDPVQQTLMLSVAGAQRVAATVIGVSRDTDVGSVAGPKRPLIFLPLSQHFDKRITIAARTSGRVASTVAALQEAVRKADPDLTIDLAGDGRVLSGFLQIVNSAGRGVLYLGTFTLLLSMAGLFGVQSHVVAYRTREIGVRMSLGATARQIKTMIVRDGARPVVDGLILGLWGGLAGRILIKSYAEADVTVFDPWMLAIAPLPIILAALFACHWPAARAARVDPTTALRYE